MMWYDCHNIELFFPIALISRAVGIFRSTAQATNSNDPSTIITMLGTKSLTMTMTTSKTVMLRSWAKHELQIEVARCDNAEHAKNKSQCRPDQSVCDNNYWLLNQTTQLQRSAGLAQQKQNKKNCKMMNEPTDERENKCDEMLKMCRSLK